MIFPGIRGEQKKHLSKPPPAIYLPKIQPHPNWHHCLKHFPYPIRFMWTFFLYIRTRFSVFLPPNIGAHLDVLRDTWQGARRAGRSRRQHHAVISLLSIGRMLDVGTSLKPKNNLYKNVEKMNSELLLTGVSIKQIIWLFVSKSKVVSFTMLYHMFLIVNSLLTKKTEFFYVNIFHFQRWIFFRDIFFPSWRLLTFWQQKTGRFFSCWRHECSELGSFLDLFMHGPIFVAELRSQAGKIWWFFTWLMVRWNMKPW